MTPRAGLLAVIRIVYPAMLVGAAWILLRGHNAPGGGFIAGLIAVAATVALAVAERSAHAQRRLPLRPASLAAAGILLALASGLPAMLFGSPYLTHLWVTLPLGIAELKLSTVYLFDIGVFAVVWGSLGGLCLRLVELDEPGGDAAFFQSGAEASSPDPEHRS